MSKMNYRITQNSEKKTITLVVSGLSIYYPDNLLERTVDGRYWATSVINTDFKGLTALVEDLIKSLNLVNPDTHFKKSNFIENEANKYPLFRFHKDRDGNVDNAKFDLGISVYSPNSQRNFFFRGLTKDHPVTDSEEIINHEWGIEIEMKPYIDDDTLEAKVYTVFHRLIEGKKVETQYQSNDNAWSGFDFEVEETPYKENKKTNGFESFQINDDDLPF